MKLNQAREWGSTYYGTRLEALYRFGKQGYEPACWTGMATAPPLRRTRALRPLCALDNAPQQLVTHTVTDGGEEL
jgi:hypothetical protein